ncbi:hypothetical protein BKA64DRAFT_208632 [Cadophora sp. MPI-SDFR-AT-0126]|nr:hypothetical protein BKA64DRAFT_208632 [Leotiomycetes sp. MPI-SDFR-AT-0126]
MWSAIRIAQVVGSSGAVWLSGNIAAVSMFTVPAIRQAHSQDGVSSVVLAKVWESVYEAGKALNPPVAAGVTSSFAYLAWSSRVGVHLPKNCSQLYGLAALLTIGIVPFTFILMAGTNNKLSAKAKRQSGAVSVPAYDDAFAKLIDRWGTLNFCRSLLPFLGGVIGLVATLA